jgi:hypothetical protein
VIRVVCAIALAVTIFRAGGFAAEGAAFVIAVGVERAWRHHIRNASA